MTQEEEQLLLKDLCARLPYGVICQLSNKDSDISITEKLELGGLEHFIFGTMDVLPYLRPMSSMTEEELRELNVVFDNCVTEYRVEAQEWLIANHFDFRGLIPMGLALEAPKDMYKAE